jgi:1-acyl-sn-glycerol-3-phosphate acyltransferase
MTDKELEKAEYLDFCSFSDATIRSLANGSDTERAAVCTTANHATTEQILGLAPLSWWEEVVTMAFLGFGVPNGVFTIPVVTFLVGRFLLGSVATAFLFLALLLIPLAIIPQPFVPSVLQSWIACRVIKYFSFRFILEERPKSPSDPQYRPWIMVAPPHGVFPYGNLLAMLVWPVLNGSTFRGLAASSALRPPIFKQILRSMGVIDASRHVARRAVEEGNCLGISTGGVAEVFETNADDECIVLKQRIGLIKLAIQTGADLVPCYLFGNTELLGCWAGEGIPNGRTLLERISRKVGFALIIIHGRFGLPIPRRVPVLGVMGKPIPTFEMKCEQPTTEQIESIQKLLLDEMQEIFERYKGLYGWSDKKLVIK